MSRRRSITIALVTLLAARVASSQTTPAEPTDSTVRLDTTALQDLPLADDVYAPLETVEGMVITDRFSSPGLGDAQPGRVGAFLNSWTQTTIRIGDVDVTSPDGGVPLLVPPLLFWRQVGVTTSSMPPDTSTPGVLITLDPQRPGRRWTSMVDALALPRAFVSRPSDPVPSIAMPDGAIEVRGIASGPLRGDRLGAVLAGSLHRSSQFDRGSPTTGASRLSTLFADLSYTPGSRTALHTVVLVQGASYPSSTRIPVALPGTSDRDTSVHAQTAWEHQTMRGSQVRAFGGLTSQARHVGEIALSPATIERLTDGPVPSFVQPAGGTRRRLATGLRFHESRSVFGRGIEIKTGVDAGRATTDATPEYPAVIRELVDGLPAREWRYSPAQRQADAITTIAGFASDRLNLTHTLSIDSALRFDGVRGRAQGASQGIAWDTWLPRASLRWTFLRKPAATFFTGYARSTDALTSAALAYGDPSAPTADVYRWSGGDNVGPLIARSGPGTGGPAALSSIDPAIRRPTTSEIDIGFDVHPSTWMRIRYALTLKRDTDELAVLDTGAPASSYSTTGIQDLGLNFDEPIDDQTLPIYDRLPSSFGADRYVLANSPLGGGTYGGQNLVLESHTSHLRLYAEAKTDIPKDRAGYVGFHSNENDPGILGELFTNPNALTHARGAPFSDRSYTVKLAGIYDFGHDIRLGAVARYQDGQPYSRIVLIPNLNQGPEPIRAVDAGLSRFTYTGTFDFRLQKGFTRGGHRVAAIVDAYNLVNMRKEVEEHVVTGPNFRDETLRQPPRTVLVGIRFSR